MAAAKYIAAPLLCCNYGRRYYLSGVEMSVFLNTRQDGSMALFIDGNLQFDQRDEKIYHEGLALPALHLALSRISTPLTVLIVGGGDGLTARELLKSNRVAKIDLVDYSAEVLDMAAKQLAHLNQMSLGDKRVNVHVNDAWIFAQDQIKQNTQYDLIVVDLTVAKDVDGAKFHSIAWYEILARLLSPEGILASNGVSPTNTPQAYWSIFNSMRVAGLASLPYRVTIPSFRQLGYGPDWGFMLASKIAVQAEEFDLYNCDRTAQFDCELLNDPARLRVLFQFPGGYDKLQAESQPEDGNSNVFLKYLQIDNAYATTDRGNWCSLKADLDSMCIPTSVNAGQFLPQEIRLRLADKTAAIFPAGGQELFEEVLALMPSVQPSYTRSMIAEFISDPASFLEGLDIRTLVNKLLARAAELPRRIASEIALLQEKLRDWAGDFESLLDLGRRVVTTLAVVIILANFVFPDSAYGKGGHGGFSHAGAHGGWNNHWGNNRGHYGGWGRPNHWRRGYGGWGYGWGGYGGYGGYGGAPYYYASGPGYQGTNYNTDQVPDSQGNQYPVRAYVQTYGNVPDQPWIPPAGSAGSSDQTPPPADASSTSVSGNILKSAYRLGPDVDVLSDGSTAVTLTDNAYLKVNPASTNLVDQQSGSTLIALFTDPTLTWHLSSELKHQAAGLKKAAQAKDITGGADDQDETTELPTEVMQTVQPADKDNTQREASEARDEAEVANMVTTAKLLDKAEETLGEPAGKAPEEASPPVEGAFELFNSAWADHDGKYVILKKTDGALVYFDGKDWYSDPGKTKLEKPYSSKLKEVITGYLSGLAKESSSTKDSLTQEQQEVQGHLDRLKAHLEKLKAGPSATASPTAGSGTDAATQGQDLVQFGTKKIPRDEAIKRMDGLIARAQKHLDAVQKEIDNLPAETEAVNKLLTNFQS